MRVSLYAVQVDGVGAISTMAKPRGGDWLIDEVRVLSDAGVSTLVCALSDAEIAEFDLTDEATVCRAAGMRFLHLPIQDLSTPTLGAVRPALSALADDLRSGHHVAVHCRFGIGRSSLIAAAVLVLIGVESDDAWDRIADARGRPVPDTDQQRPWLRQVVER